MSSISQLLNPRSIAVVGASPRGGRGGRTLVNLRETQFQGEIFAINPRYDEVLGFPCYASVDDLPAPVDCLVLAIGAEAASETLAQAFGRGVRAAVVLAAGFGEGGDNAARADRLRDLGRQGMSVCGPNCYGLLSVKPGSIVSAYSGRLPAPLIAGGVALISQSGGLANNAFAPLMSDRKLGFRYVVSCGNQLATTIEDYMEAFVEDADVSIIAAIVESIKNPDKLLRVSRLAHQRGKPMVFFPIGRSQAGRSMTRSHTGALVGDFDVLSGFLRRCGIVSVDGYDEFVETIELFALAPPDRDVSREVIVVSGSGGGAAIAADALERTGLELPAFSAAIAERLGAVLPDFGHVMNPLDGTGSMSDDPAVLAKTLAVIAGDASKAMIAVTVTARQPASAKERRFAQIVAETAQASGRALIAFQHSPLGGPLDAEIMETLHSARAPLLLGSATAMGVLRHLPEAQDYRRRAIAAPPERRRAAASGAADRANARDFNAQDFLAVRSALVAAGVEVVETCFAASEREAVDAFKRLDRPVAVKVEAKGLLHKSDLDGVRLNRASEAEVAAAYREVVKNARRGGFSAVDGVLVQPMTSGVAEALVGVVNDPTFGPAICVGLGGLFVEIFKDTTIELAPLSHADAMAMIRRLKAAPILFGARGRPRADIEALAELIVRLGEFALANAGWLRALDLNPVIVKAEGQGALAVDIAVDSAPRGRHTEFNRFQESPKG